MASEKRPIDAEELWKKFESEPWYDNADRDEIALPMVDDAPTMDAVEVVRCKDCKHWHEETGWCDQHSWFIEEDGEPCHPWESNNWKMLNEDDFCSYGERKDNAVSEM